MMNASLDQTQSCQVNLKDGSLIVGEEEIPLKKLKACKEPNCYKAVLTEGVCLPLYPLLQKQWFQ